MCDQSKETFFLTQTQSSQIEENSKALEYLAQWGSASSLETPATPTREKDRWKEGARKTLLQWVSNALPK